MVTSSISFFLSFRLYRWHFLHLPSLNAASWELLTSANFLDAETFRINQYKLHFHIKHKILEIWFHYTTISTPSAVYWTITRSPSHYSLTYGSAVNSFNMYYFFFDEFLEKNKERRAFRFNVTLFLSLFLFLLFWALVLGLIIISTA